MAHAPNEPHDIHISTAIKALQAIAGGHFPGASTLAIAGDWRAMYQQLQLIAKTALNGE